MLVDFRLVHFSGLRSMRVGFELLCLGLLRFRLHGFRLPCTGQSCSGKLGPGWALIGCVGKILPLPGIKIDAVSVDQGHHLVLLDQTAGGASLDILNPSFGVCDHAVGEVLVRRDSAQCPHGMPLGRHLHLLHPNTDHLLFFRGDLRRPGRHEKRGIPSPRGFIVVIDGFHRHAAGSEAGLVRRVCRIHRVHIIEDLPSSLIGFLLSNSAMVVPGRTQKRPDENTKETDGK